MTTPQPQPLMTITLGERDARFILEALAALEAKWQNVNRTTTDEDEQAEYGMDAIVLGMTREKFEHHAVETFGQGVSRFLHETQPAPVPVATTNGDHVAPR